jgi:hypothetical protein
MRSRTENRAAPFISGRYLGAGAGAGAGAGVGMVSGTAGGVGSGAVSGAVVRAMSVTKVTRNIAKPSNRGRRLVANHCSLWPRGGKAQQPGAGPRCGWVGVLGVVAEE